MITTIDVAGRLVVPKALRERMGLKPGTQIEVEERNGELTLRPVGPRAVAVERDGRTVLTTGTPTPLLEHEDLLRMIDESRGWPR
ncbi:MULTISPECIES: AbrB/MazE/SpoVT family DNA-binding domain-containing protein [unclassified Frankia]|uniref:AbrB/MazE/SpoVT family DNA-binding domain-containing protein n=1 Tax=unclassified Frankia TaxID=2632575 RepID=UPI002AD4514D|nr:MULTISPECIES: AbrB/MazE/SpoVT family DNA-binding domain-containing protein [unclassified Frankia]